MTKSVRSRTEGERRAFQRQLQAASPAIRAAARNASRAVAASGRHVGASSPRGDLVASLRGGGSRCGLGLPAGDQVPKLAPPAARTDAHARTAHGRCAEFLRETDEVVFRLPGGARENAPARI